jgi:hypothetical protein
MRSGYLTCVAICAAVGCAALLDAQSVEYALDAGDPSDGGNASDASVTTDVLLLGTDQVGEDDNLAFSRPYVFSVTAQATGVPATLALLLGTRASSTVIVGIYASTDDGGAMAGTLLYKGSIASPTLGDWNYATLAPSAAPVALQQGAPYWLAVLGPGTDAGFLKVKDTLEVGPSYNYGALVSDLPAVWTNQPVQRHNSPLSAYVTN